MMMREIFSWNIQSNAMWKSDEILRERTSLTVKTSHWVYPSWSNAKTCGFSIYFCCHMNLTKHILTIFVWKIQQIENGKETLIIVLTTKRKKVIALSIDNKPYTAQLKPKSINFSHRTSAIFINFMKKDLLQRTFFHSIPPKSLFVPSEASGVLHTCDF